MTGPAVPLLLLFVAGATVAEGIRPASFWATTALEKIGLGVLAGIVVGLLAGELARRARRSGSTTPTSEGLALAGVAVAVFVFTQELGGSGLVAAFVAGLAASTRLSEEDEPALGFAEEEGAVAATFVFFALGLVGVELLDQLTWRVRLRRAQPRPGAAALGRAGLDRDAMRWPTNGVHRLVRPARPGIGGAGAGRPGGGPRAGDRHDHPDRPHDRAAQHRPPRAERRPAHAPLRRLGGDPAERRARAGPRPALPASRGVVLGGLRRGDATSAEAEGPAERP